MNRNGTGTADAAFAGEANAAEIDWDALRP